MKNLIKEYSYYLFDADGTLIDTTEMICQCFLHTCTIFGCKDVSREKIIKNIGLTLRRQMEVYFGVLTDAEFAERSDVHMKYQLSIYPQYLRLFPTVKQGLQKLRDLGKKCAVVTSRRRNTLDIYLKETGIFDFFDVIVTPESTDKHKPDPEPAYKAMSLLNVESKKQAVFIGDSEFDIECGSKAGIDTAFVGWSNNDPALLPSTPTYIIHDLTDFCCTP